MVVRHVLSIWPLGHDSRAPIGARQHIVGSDAPQDFAIKKLNALTSYFRTQVLECNLSVDQQQPLAVSPGQQLLSGPLARSLCTAASLSVTTKISHALPSGSVAQTLSCTA